MKKIIKVNLSDWQFTLKVELQEDGTYKAYMTMPGVLHGDIDITQNLPGAMLFKIIQMDKEKAA